MSQKSGIVHYFSLQISDHTFFVTSQLLKQEKTAAFFFNQRQLSKGCWFWTIVKQKNVSLCCCLDKKKKKLLTSFVCFLLSSFWRTTLPGKTEKRCFFSQRQVLFFFPWQKSKSLLCNKFSKIVSLFFHRCSTLAMSLKFSTEFSTKTST